MLKWIVWNRTVFDIETVVLMQNWIVWNRTVYMHKNALITNNDWCAIKPNQTHTYIYIYT